MDVFKKEDPASKQSNTSNKVDNPGVQIIRESAGETAVISFGQQNVEPSLEKDPNAFQRTFDVLLETPSITRIILSKKQKVAYGFDDVQQLLEVTAVYRQAYKRLRDLEHTRLLDPNSLKTSGYLVQVLLKSDPIGCFVELKRIKRQESINPNQNEMYYAFLTEMYRGLQQTKLIKKANSFLAGHTIGQRDIYMSIFSPITVPGFMNTRIDSDFDDHAKELDFYTIKNMLVTIVRNKNETQPTYHVSPPEFSLSQEKYALMELARAVMSEHSPAEKEFINPSKMRRTFFNIGRDLILELAQSKNVSVTLEEVDELANILVRYTVGFGVIEAMLQDEKVQDITINSPIGDSPVFIVHQDFGDCKTNIFPTLEDSELWATRFRLTSGRPLDEANPVLDTELSIPGARARVSAVTNPLNPYGLSFAFRRHRDKPWTLPLFINNGMIDPLAAGLISFIVEGGRAILFAGTRSSGKTSLLGSVLTEIMRKTRIITIEDTLELPTNSLKDLGFNIQSLKVRSALGSSKGGEVSAEEGIRTSLRLGDSSLIVGEIRSTEAKALFEAMRIGALANVVAGTIHGSSPYAVFDRVVNDLGVPRTSFKAIDIIIISNPIKTPDGLSSVRRVLQVTEIRKNWEEDPLRENGFVDLLKYNPKTDKLEPTDALINGDSEVIKEIAAKVPEWVGDWDSVWGNIQLRADLKELFVKHANQQNNKFLLEADHSIQAGETYHLLVGKSKKVKGKIDNKFIKAEFKK